MGKSYHPGNRHEQLRKKLMANAPDHGDWAEPCRVRNRVRRGKLPRFTSSKTKRVFARGRVLGGYYDRRVEFVA